MPDPHLSDSRLPDPRLPDFLIIGAMKAGTSTLYTQLSAHPQIGMSREKETDFFLTGPHSARALERYKAQFPKGRDILGEASPNYTKHEAFPGVPARVAALIPDCRLIFLARDPVARAQSQYRHALLSGVSVPPPQALAGTRHYEHLIDTSRYAAQLDPWLKHFGEDRFLFLEFESYISDPGPTLSRVAGFLGVADAWPAQARAVNSSGDLARLPPWLFRFRKSAAASAIKRVLPARAREAAKAALRAPHARHTPGFPDDLRQRMRADLTGDAARFRVLSGLPCTRWEL